MKNKTLESKTDTRPNLSPYQAESAEAQQTPALRPDPLGETLAPPDSEAMVRAHAAGLTLATAGRTLRRLQRQYGNRYVQRVIDEVQRRGSGEGFQLDDETAGRINRARSGGQPLNGAVQPQMSEALGHDFSGVRVHTDSEADELNHQLSARAFTTGHDIFFCRGEYNPGSGSGHELLAHELSHVVQQSRGRVSGGSGGMTVRPAGDAFEHEAEATAQEANKHLNNPDLQRAVANPADILALQRSYGNQAVQRLLAQRQPEVIEANMPVQAATLIQRQRDSDRFNREENIATQKPNGRGAGGDRKTPQSRRNEDGRAERGVVQRRLTEAAINWLELRKDDKSERMERGRSLLNGPEHNLLANVTGDCHETVWFVSRLIQGAGVAMIKGPASETGKVGAMYGQATPWNGGLIPYGTPVGFKNVNNPRPEVAGYFHSAIAIGQGAQVKGVNGLNQLGNGWQAVDLARLPQTNGQGPSYRTVEGQRQIQVMIGR
jgi:hypothetical protein